MLGRFLWRFARMSAAQRGHDTTAIRILTASPEYVLMRERADVPQKNAQEHIVNEHARLLFKASVSNSSAQWWKLRDSSSSANHTFRRRVSPAAPLVATSLWILQTPVVHSFSSKTLGG